MEGLEALEKIGRCYVASEGKDLMSSETYGDNWDIIANELKALEIINNRRIDVDWFKECNSYTAYNKSWLIYSKITQDEYELVNKVLNKEE